MSAIGPSPTSGDVRYLVAIRGKADENFKAIFDTAKTASFRFITPYNFFS
jgi:hypothetical protein